ncbi:hypothetical protein MTR_5g076210 [Medicago truncatula]|uniref:Uncharacterized protein n=1 Tax=Medicago truncatula TaxID=3880 RepID=G7K5Y6_MEDTR|nr:hypothetical protein MTR_5g076210 [Medicago truncatula]
MKERKRRKGERERGGERGRESILTAQLQLNLFYPGGGVVDSLSCTILGSATKRLKESDLVVTQHFGR